MSEQPRPKPTAPVTNRELFAVLMPMLQVSLSLGNAIVALNAGKSDEALGHLQEQNELLRTASDRVFDLVLRSGEQSK